MIRIPIFFLLSPFLFLEVGNLFWHVIGDGWSCILDSRPMKGGLYGILG
jgi:hypothetical protein